jgi:hypothetical protein
VARFLLISFRDTTKGMGEAMFDQRKAAKLELPTTGPRDIAKREATAAKAPTASPLFTRLTTIVNRRRLVLDRCYFQLVSEIAELLSDEEVALLALYLAPPLTVGVPSREHRLALSIMRKRRKGMAHA